MEKILETYKYLQSIGIPNEDARYVLPNACETILEIKMNGRELIHVYNERGCTRAQWEIRELVQLMKAAIEAEGGEAAEFAKFLVPKCERFGKNYAFCPEHSSCGRHPRLKDLKFDKIK
jgi:thymidylate synthase (FAD)